MAFLVFRLGWKLSKHISLGSPLKTGHSIVRPECGSHIEISSNKSGHKGYNYQNSGHNPSSCLLFKTQLNSVGLFVPHRKQYVSVMSPVGYCNH
jgi:hypothetical protein